MKLLNQLANWLVCTRNNSCNARKPLLFSRPHSKALCVWREQSFDQFMKTKYKNTSTFQCQLTWILYPLRDITPVTMLRTPGQSLTIIDKVCDWIPLDWNIERRPKICIVMTLLFKSYNCVIKWHWFWRVNQIY